MDQALCFLHFSFYQNVKVLIESPKHRMVHRIKNYNKTCSKQGKEKRVDQCQKLLIAINPLEKQ